MRTVGDGNFNKNHPEIREGEVFLINCSEDDFRIMSWETKRRGQVAYDFQGSRSGLDKIYPVFIKREELEKVKGQFSVYGPSHPVI